MFIGLVVVGPLQGKTCILYWSFPCLMTPNDNSTGSHVAILGHIILIPSLPLLNYLAFQSLDFERTWWKLFQKRVVRTKLDIYVFTTRLSTYYLMPRIERRSSKYQFNTHWLNHLEARNHDLPQSKRIVCLLVFIIRIYFLSVNYRKV